MSRPDLTEQDVLRRMREAMTAKQQEACTHPTEHIRDLPTGSVCRKCGESVAPLMRDSAPSSVVRNHRTSGMDWMGRTKKSVFPMFPSSGEE